LNKLTETISLTFTPCTWRRSIPSGLPRPMAPATPAYRSPVSAQRPGFSYVEVMISMVIISVLLVASLRLFANLGRSRQHTLDRDNAAWLAVEMIQEIKQQDYNDPCAAAFGPELGESTLSRSDFDDIDDYDGWTASPPQDPRGTPLTQYPDLTRSVAVRFVTANDFNQTAATDEGFKEVTISLARGGSIVTVQKYVIADALLAPRPNLSHHQMGH